MKSFAVRCGSSFLRMWLFVKKFLINCADLCIKYTRYDDRGIAQLVEHRSPKPRVVSSNLTAPAKENQGLARNRKPFYSDFFMQNTRTQNQTVSKPSQNENYRTRQEQMTILYLAFCLLFSKIIRSAFTCFSIRSRIPRLSTQSRRYSG